MPIAQQNWLGMQDLENLLALNHWDVIRRGTAQLLPIDLPLVAPLVNRYVAPLPGVRHFALTQFFVCRPASGPIPTRDYSCSVIVPCKNERGNIEDIVARTPEMGRGTELIFVDGNSNDGTVAEIEKQLAKQQAVESFERTFLLDLLTRNDGHMSRAAREAGVDRKTIERMVKKHGLRDVL
jgi:hypothetical protein